MKYDKNVWIIKLKNDKGSFIIDEQDLEKVKKYNWFPAKARQNISPMANVKVNDIWKGIRITKLILNQPRGMVVDHINGNTLDNRRSNLRICTRQQNRLNSKCPIGSKTGIKGVWPAGKKWTSTFRFNGKKHYLGVFPTIEEAQKKYQEEVIKYHKEYTYGHHVC